MSYFLLLFYAYALIGPWPIVNLRVYLGFGIFWSSIMFLMYVTLWVRNKGLCSHSCRLLWFIPSTHDHCVCSVGVCLPRL